MKFNKLSFLFLLNFYSFIFSDSINTLQQQNSFFFSYFYNSFLDNIQKNEKIKEIESLENKENLENRKNEYIYEHKKEAIYQILKVSAIKFISTIIYLELGFEYFFNKNISNPSLDSIKQIQNNKYLIIVGISGIIFFSFFLYDFIDKYPKASVYANARFQKLLDKKFIFKGNLIQNYKDSVINEIIPNAKKEIIDGLNKEKIKEDNFFDYSKKFYNRYNNVIKLGFLFFCGLVLFNKIKNIIF